MPEESQDQLIRRKLESVRIPFRESDWNLFWREYLLPAQSGTNTFDALISESLSSLELSPSEQDWALFEAMLPADAPVISLHPDRPAEPEPEQFSEPIEEPWLAADLAIAARLAEAEVEFQPADWDLMAASLDGNPFDQAIRSQLHQYQVPYEQQDWMDMSARLDAPMYASVAEHLGTMEASFRHSDWRMFARQWLGYRPWYLQWRNYAGAAAVILLLLSFALPGLIQRPDSSESTANTETQPITAPDDTRLAENTPRETNGANQLPVNNSPLSSPEETDASQNLVVTSGIDRESGAVEEIALRSETAATTASPQHRPTPERADTKPSAIRVQKIAHRPAEWNALGFPEKAPAWIHWLPKGTQLNSFSVGLYASYGRTRAELSSRNTTPGYTTGARVELGLTEEVSLITGIQYEERGFSHRFFSYTPTQQPIENLVEADLELAEIPLLVRYYIPIAPAVRIYGQTGIVAMVSLEEEYQLYQKRSSFSPGPSIDGGNLRLADPAGGQRRSLETYAGNVYGGLGLDVRLSDVFHVQVEPYYLLSLQKTRGSGSLGVEKRMYYGGIGASLLYRIK